MNTLEPYPQPPADVPSRPVAIAEADLKHPRTLTAFRRIKLLVSGYLGISLLSLVAIVLLRNNAAAVNSAVWTRGTIVALSASLMFAFTVRAARGSGRAYLRLRIISAVMVVAIVVIVALLGTFPLWMKIEQAACGLVLIGVAVLVNGRHLHPFSAPGESGPLVISLSTLDRNERGCRAGQPS